MALKAQDPGGEGERGDSRHGAAGLLSGRELLRTETHVVPADCEHREEDDEAQNRRGEQGRHAKQQPGEAAGATAQFGAGQHLPGQHVAITQSSLRLANALRWRQPAFLQLGDEVEAVVTQFAQAAPYISRCDSATEEALDQTCIGNGIGLTVRYLSSLQGRFPRPG